MTKSSCCETIYHGMWPSKCSKPAKVIVDGNSYCTIHDPARVSERAAAQRKRWEEEASANAKKHADMREMQRRAACFPELLAALELCMKAIINQDFSTVTAALAVGADAIAKSKGESL